MKNIVTILKYEKYFGKGKKMGWKARPEEPPPHVFLPEPKYCSQDSYSSIFI